MSVLRAIWGFIVVAAKAVYGFATDLVTGTWLAGVGTGVSLFALLGELFRGSPSSVILIVFIVTLAACLVATFFQIRALQKRLKATSTGA
jgi:hypothetical protein